MLAVLVLAGCPGQTDSTEKIRQDVWNTVKTINRHWAVTEDMDSLALYLHPDMVIIYPDSGERMRGRSGIIASYRSYADFAETVSLKETDPLIQLYNDNKTAVVTYYYDLEIKTPDEAIKRFTGRDMYTLIREKNKWIAVAQQYSPMPE